MRVRPAHRIAGRAEVAGDKSVSHRALILGALAEGECRIEGLGTGADVKATASCLRALGVSLEWEGQLTTVTGVGLRGLKAPAGPLDCGNSGTTMRLLAGLLAGANVSATLQGDESLSRRPMRRILAPLRAMGARCSGRLGGGDERAPLEFSPTARLRGGHHALKVASAQVKTCLMFAALHAAEPTTLVQTAPTRTHSEHLFPLFGAPVEVEGLTLRIPPLVSGLRAPALLEVPGDPSSAAFLLIAAALFSDGDVAVPDLCIEPLRVGFLEVLRRMGARVTVEKAGRKAGDLVGLVRVQGSSQLRATRIDAEEVPSLLDEIPALAVLATQAEGVTVIEGAAELRLKESDRLATVSASLRSMGASVEETEDGLVITGPTPLHASRIDCGEDHRIAMSFALAGLVADEGVELFGAEQVDTSFPGFFKTLASLAEPR